MRFNPTKEFAKHLESLYFMVVGKFMIELFRSDEKFREYIAERGFSFLFKDT